MQIGLFCTFLVPCFRFLSLGLLVPFSLDNPSFTAPVAFIAIQQNTQCSIDITANQVNQPAGSGYQILFANTLNNTDVRVPPLAMLAS